MSSLCILWDGNTDNPKIKTPSDEKLKPFLSKESAGFGEKNITASVSGLSDSKVLKVF